MLKRLFDLFSSAIGILILSPILLSLWLIVVIDSKGGGFYRQVRVGLNGRDFKLWKFRTMRIGADQKGLLTVGGRDPRVTRVGYYLRKYKLDELPQLFNVFVGEMSLVGPRPEVRRYVDLYSQDQRQVLSIRPGITDYASIAYSNENDLLAASSDPEKTYIEEIMPAKLALNKKYMDEKDVWKDLRILFITVGKVIRH
jgi:lipopolysaccharide/colanic/teichoic acid biosynthesis glycosyltransferase